MRILWGISLYFALAVLPAMAAPVAADLVAAQTTLTTDPSAAAAHLREAAGLASAITPTVAPPAVETITTFLAWANDPVNQAAQPTVCSSIFTSLLTLASTPQIIIINPDLYAEVLAKAQTFVDATPPEDLKVVELSNYLQLALGTATPPNIPAPPAPPSAD